MTTKFPIGSRVVRSDGLPATVIDSDNIGYSLSYDEGGYGWWPAGSIDWLVVPRWVEFGTAVMVDAAVNQMLGSIVQTAPGLFGGLIIGLQKAADGDPLAFLKAWTACRQMKLIDKQLAKSVQAIAAEHDLPDTFVTALTTDS
jgi:hypothetical protein